MNIFEEMRKSDRKNIWRLNSFLWSGIKLLLASVLMTQLDYGIYIVLGYVLYSLESNSGLLFINSQEITENLNEVHRLNNTEISELKKKVEDIEFRLSESEDRLDANDL